MVLVQLLQFYGVNCVFPAIICWNPNARCDGIWSWGLWQIMRFRWGHRGGVLKMGLVPLQEETRELALSLCEDTEGRRPSTHQEGSSHQKPTTLACWPWTSGLYSCEEIQSCCLSRPVCDFLLRQPKLRDTDKQNPLKVVPGGQKSYIF